MQIELRLFARAKDLAGAETITVDVPETATGADLRAAIAEQFPTLTPIASSLLLSAGTDYLSPTEPLSGKSDFAAFPPVSGG